MKKKHSAEMRRALFNERYLEHMLEVILEDSTSPALENPVGSREIVWHCFPLFEAGGEYASRANSILRHMELRICHFMPMNFTQLLTRYGHLMDDDVKNKLEEYIRKMIPLGKDERLHISMYNDNFAGMAIYTLLVAGELFNLPEYIEIGLEKLRGVGELFMRCGAIMEYGSNTYTPIDTLCYAEIANHVKNPEARELALKCEERMWTEIAAHYHPETSRMAGPHSRSYSIDMVGHPHLFSGLAWYVFGDRVFSNPMNDLFEPHANQVMHGGLENLTLPNIAWIMNCEYHCPEYLEELAFNKKYPYETENMVECIPGNYTDDVPDEIMNEWPGVRSRNYTYMTDEFAMGTAQSQFHSGSITDSFAVTYRNREKAERLFDTGVIYSRYIFNGHTPGRENEYKIFGKVNYMGFRDEGRKISIQDKGTAVVSYKPKHYERESVASAYLSILVPIHFFDDVKIYTNDELLDEFPYHSKKTSNVYMNIHKSYFAFIPLEATDLGRDIAMSIEKRDHHIMINFYNYRGEERSFGEKELVLSRNGFVCIGDTDCGTIEQFIESIGGYTLGDKMEKQEGAWFRKIRFKSDKTDLNLVYSPLTEGMIVSTVNNRPTGLHVLKVDGLDLRKTPFL